MISLFTPSLFNLSISYLSISIKGAMQHPKNIMFPAHRSFADPYDKIMVFRENPAKKMAQFGKKSAKVYHCLYSSIEQLQVAL
jgi:hypothetical protein